MKLRALLSMGLALVLMAAGCAESEFSNAPGQSKRAYMADTSASQVAVGLQGEEAPKEIAEEEFHRERYARIDDNPFIVARDQALSTFSTDVDTASYANVRRFLNAGQAPPADAVRIEELINYFPYDYLPPEDGRPFALHTEISHCPWREGHQLLRIGIKGREIKTDRRPASNLVFLIDTSGSMQSDDKLALVQRGLRLLVEQLTENDRVALVTYAGSSGLVLPSTPGNEHAVILAALDQLTAGGSTNGGEGIQLAYSVAAKNLIPEGTNRVILATDGDFNVGITSDGDLTRLIEEQAKSGVFLSVLGFGTGNYNDTTMESLADRGNGNFAYIDGLNEARKVLVEQLTGTLTTIAKDVKIQVEFNPAKVGAYRLIGYENRLLRDQDFNDDQKDAGDIGAGHTVTALYEIVPATTVTQEDQVDPLRYQQPGTLTAAAQGDELLTLKLRYKLPDADASELIQQSVSDSPVSFARSSTDHQFAAAVAAYGMLLRDSPHQGTANWKMVEEIAQGARGNDLAGYRAEFIGLLKLAGSLE